MRILDMIAEQKILEAMDRGEFDNLPGAGKPLALEDDSMVPEELRVAYKILRNAGCIPPELELHKEIVSLRSLLRTIEDKEERAGKLRELSAKILRFNLMRKRPLNIEDFPEYEKQILGREKR